MNELIRRVETLQELVERFLAGLQLPPKSNHAATAAPAITDDAADGYQVGSLWTNITTDTAYICCDATAGAAVWKQITP